MKLFVFLYCSIFPFLASGQTDSLFRFNKLVAGEFSDFAVDNLNNVYLLSSSGQLKKINSRGDSVAVYNDIRRYGKLYAIDVTNPLKVLLHFKDFGTVVVLDRFLSKRGVIDLRKIGLYQVKAVAQAYDNGYWVFDEQESKVKHLNDAGEIIDQFTDFRLLFDSMPSPQVIVDQNKNLYLYDEKKGIYLFDYFGGFRKRIPYTGWKDFLVINNQVFGRDDKRLYRYDHQTLRMQEYTMNQSMATAQKLLITTENIYVLTAQGLAIYAIGTKAN